MSARVRAALASPAARHLAVLACLAGACTAVVSELPGGILEVSASGASKVTLRGQANPLTVELSGASSLEARDLKSKTAKLTASGASHIAVTATEEVQAHLSD